MSSAVASVISKRGSRQNQRGSRMSSGKTQNVPSLTEGSSQPTPPVVPDATREAVRAEVWYARYSDREPGEVADRILAPAGPIASEIARLTGENNAWETDAHAWQATAKQADLECRVAWSSIEELQAEAARLTGENTRLDHNCQEWVRQAAENAEAADRLARRAEAAEAETARLRAAAGDLLEMSAYLVSRHTRIQNGQPVRDLGEAAAAYVTACTSVRAALSSQEKTDA
jgi:hypothetical protein